jgi:hypothetical protein
MPFDLNSNVMFYGPTGSGKSAILAAFQIVMAKTPPLHSRFHEKIDITLKTGDDPDDPNSLKPVDLGRCDLSQIGPTQQFMDEHTFFSFARIPRDRGDDLNAAQHKGMLRSPAGRNFEDLINAELNNNQSTEEEDGAYVNQLIQENLGGSNTIIVVIDGRDEKPADRRRFYDLLRTLSGEINGIPRHFAFCVTKVDQQKVLKVFSERDILIRFGLLNLFNTLQGKGARARVFKISPWGFLEDGITPNVKMENTPAGQTFVNRFSHKPYNIHHPFCWAFQGVERAKIRIAEEKRPRFEKYFYPKERVLQDYIPYDPEYDK